MNNTCRLITGCLKPTNTSNLHLLAGIAPANIRREVASRVAITKATSDERHLLHGHHPLAQRLKSRRSFLSHVQPLTKSREETRLQPWMEKLENDPPPTVMGIPPPPTEDLSLAKKHHGLSGKHSTAWERERDNQKLLWSDGATRLAQPPVNVEKQTTLWSTALSALYYPTLAAQKTLQCSVKMQRTV